MLNIFKNTWLLTKLCQYCQGVQESFVFFSLPINKSQERSVPANLRMSQQGYLGIQASLVRFFISSIKELKNGHKEKVEYKEQTGRKGKTKGNFLESRRGAPGQTGCKSPSCLEGKNGEEKEQKLPA